VDGRRSPRASRGRKSRGARRCRAESNKKALPELFVGLQVRIGQGRVIAAFSSSSTSARRQDQATTDIAAKDRCAATAQRGHRLQQSYIRFDAGKIRRRGTCRSTRTVRPQHRRGDARAWENPGGKNQRGYSSSSRASCGKMFIPLDVSILPRTSGRSRRSPVTEKKRPGRRVEDNRITGTRGLRCRAVDKLKSYDAIAIAARARGSERTSTRRNSQGVRRATRPNSLIKALSTPTTGHPRVKDDSSTVTA